MVANCLRVAAGLLDLALESVAQRLHGLALQQFLAPGFALAHALGQRLGEVGHTHARPAVRPLHRLGQRIEHLAKLHALGAGGVGRAPVALGLRGHTVTDPLGVDQIGVALVAQAVRCPGLCGARDQLVVVAPVVLAQRVRVALVGGRGHVAAGVSAQPLDGRLHLVALLVVAPVGAAYQKITGYFFHILHGSGLVFQGSQQGGANSDRLVRVVPVAFEKMVQRVNPLVVDRAVAFGVGQVDHRHRALRAWLVGRKVR